MQDSLQPSTVINDQLESLVDRPQSYKGSDAPAHNHQPMHIALLTGANDPTYAQDLALSLAARGVDVDFIGSDDVRAPLDARIHFLNLRGGQSRNAGALAKVVRILRYYGRLMCYAWTARPLAFHILWNNKFEMLDRTLLMAWYRMAGRRIFFTAHNVNVGKRDDQDSRMNRLTLRIQYRLATHIFVHTNKMKRELQVEFDVPVSKVSVIPFATPDVTPSTNLSPLQARQRLGLAAEDKVLLFFGQIAPTKASNTCCRHSKP